MRSTVPVARAAEWCRRSARRSGAGRGGPSRHRAGAAAGTARGRSCRRGRRARPCRTRRPPARRVARGERQAVGREPLTVSAPPSVGVAAAAMWRRAPVQSNRCRPVAQLTGPRLDRWPGPSLPGAGFRAGPVRWSGPSTRPPTGTSPAARSVSRSSQAMREGQVARPVPVEHAVHRDAAIAGAEREPVHLDARPEHEARRPLRAPRPGRPRPA